MRNTYEVFVGNIGSIHVGHNKGRAQLEFGVYVEQSRAGYGRAAGEDVVLLTNGDISQEFTGSLSSTTKGDAKWARQLRLDTWKPTQRLASWRSKGNGFEVL